MSEYCPKCGDKTSEDDSRLCANCQAGSSFAASGGYVATEPDFPPACRNFLNALYEANSATTTEEKIAALKRSTGTEHGIMTGAQNDSDLLKMLEFFELTKRKLL